MLPLTIPIRKDLFSSSKIKPDPEAAVSRFNESMESVNEEMEILMTMMSLRPSEESMGK